MGDEVIRRGFAVDGVVGFGPRDFRLCGLRDRFGLRFGFFYPFFSFWIATCNRAENSGNGRDEDDRDGQNARDLKIEAVGLQHGVDADEAIVHVVRNDGGPNSIAQKNNPENDADERDFQAANVDGPPADNWRGETPTPQRG